MNTFIMIVTIFLMLMSFGFATLSIIRKNFDSAFYFTIFDIISSFTALITSIILFCSYYFAEILSDVAYATMFSVSYSLLFFAFGIIIVSNGVRFNTPLLKNKKLDKIVKYITFGLGGLSMILTIIIGQL